MTDGERAVVADGERAVSVGGDEGPGVLRVFSCVNLYEVMGLVRLWL